jgi:hypothetical protein
MPPINSQINEELDKVSFPCRSLAAHAARALLLSGQAAFVDDDCKRILNEQLIVQLFHHAGHGNLDDAEKILALSPELILERAEIKDIAGNSFYIYEDGEKLFLTIAQYVWWARDWRMMKMLHQIADSSGQISKFSLQINQLEVNGICRHASDGSIHIEKCFSFAPIIQAYESLYHHRADASIVRAPLASEQMKLPAWIRMELCSLDSKSNFLRETGIQPRSLKFFCGWERKAYRWDASTKLNWNRIIANDDFQTAVTAYTLSPKIGYEQFMNDRDLVIQMNARSRLYFEKLSRFFSSMAHVFSWSDFSYKSACSLL